MYPADACRWPLLCCCVVSQYLRRLALAIDTALNMSGGLAATAAAATAAVAGRNAAADPGTAAPAQHQQQQGRRKKQHVADLLLVKARPMYGFYQDDRLFIKVVL